MRPKAWYRPANTARGFVQVLAVLVGGDFLLPGEAGAANICMTLVKSLPASQRALLGPRQQMEQVEEQFNSIYAQEQQLKAQAAQARCDKRGSDLAACARIEPQLAEIIAVRRGLQNKHNKLVSQVSRLESTVKANQAAWKKNCSEGPPPPAAPTLTEEQLRQRTNQQTINTFIGIGIEMLGSSGVLSGGGGGMAAPGGCPLGTHVRKDGQPGCHAD